MSDKRDDDPKDKQDESIHLYFLGNSYTSSHNLAQLTQQALMAGIPNIHVHVESHHPPGETFGGHWTNLTGGGGKGTGHGLHRAMVLRQDRRWDWTILQNQSQVPGFIHDDPTFFQGTVDDAQKLLAYIREHNPQTRFCFAMTWGRRQFDKLNPEIFSDFLTMQSKLTAGYLQYVAATSTPDRPTYLAPCGLVFQTIYQDEKNPTEAGSLFSGLFERDGSHPSLAGSYVTAVTIYATLTGKDARELDWIPEHLDPQVAAKLRDAVSRTIEETASTGLIRYPWQVK